jgi:hypothetical protein
MRVTIAHEFHHAIQMGAYGYWTNDAYFYEMTSTWMEDVVYPDVDDYLNYLSSSWPYSHFVVPDKPFDTDDLTMYSRGIWCHYIAKRFGTIAMRRCWEHIRVLRPLRAIDVALQDLGTGFSAAYGEWMLWNFFTGPRADTSAYYHEGNLYPSVAMVPANFDPPQETRTLTNSLTNLGGRYHDVRRLLDTLVLAVSYVDMAAWSEGSSPTQSYTYSLTTRGGGSGYTSLGNGISIKLDAPVIASWHSLAFLNGKLAGEAGLPEMRSGLAFPSPFISDGFNFVNITVPTSTRTAGTLMLFSSSMDLVRSEKISTALVGRQQCAQWDGKHSSGSLAPTGIYFYHLEYTDPASGSQRRMDGKLVLIRK